MPKPSTLTLAVSAALALLGGCASGPDYKAPTAPVKTPSRCRRRAANR
jgi:hypothetical protein